MQAGCAHSQPHRGGSAESPAAGGAGGAGRSIAGFVGGGMARVEAFHTFTPLTSR